MTIFPYQKHLEQEIEYLRAQLAQKDRRIDEMQQSLTFSLKYWQDHAKDEVRRRLAVSSPLGKAMAPVQPKGWDQVRASLRLNGKPEPDEPEKEDQNGVEK